jgi:hypothetical protein
MPYGQGCTVDDVGDVGQRIGDGYQVAFLRGGDEFAYLLVEQGDAELGQGFIYVGAW